MIKSLKTSAFELASYLGTIIDGENRVLNGISSISNLECNTLSFVTNSDYTINDVGAVLIVPLQFVIEKEHHNTYIKVKNPRQAFAQVLNKYYKEEQEWGIAATAIVSSSTSISKNCKIGDYCIIEDNVAIGDGTVLDNNVTIKNGTKIGKYCRIGTNSVIGNEGLSTVSLDNGKVLSIPHLGGVILEDNVEIGANSTIGRGVIEDTKICQGVKIGPQVNIGHNSYINENTQIAGRAQISGSVIIGKCCFIGANCSIKDKIKIGNYCKIGIGATVIRNVKDHISIKTIDGRPILEMLRAEMKLFS